MFNSGTSSKPIGLQCLALLLAAGVGSVYAAVPFKSATITRIENKVAVGEVKGGRNALRPASVSEVISDKDFLSTESESRAELRFPDKTIVRVGQNTVFSFDADSRTLSLQKGAMIFYVPPGGEGGQIKTPSLTAAITGTIAKVTENLIAVLAGMIKTPWGDVHRGEAIEFINGQHRIFKFDLSEAWKGKLVFFGGPLPEIPEIGSPAQLLGMPNLHFFDVMEWSQVNPRVNAFINTPKPKEKTVTTTTPTPTPTPAPTAAPTESPFIPRIGPRG